MDHVLVLFVIVVCLACALATIAVWAPRKLWIRAVAVVVAGFMLPVAYLSLNELMSRPKPVSIEWARAATQEATVIASSVREGEAIYLWLLIGEEITEPRAYVLPWNKSLAKQLHEAQREVGKKGGSVAMRQPFEATLDESHRKFYARPQARRPLKPAPAQSPRRYAHPRMGS